VQRTWKWVGAVALTAGCAQPAPDVCVGLPGDLPVDWGHRPDGFDEGAFGADLVARMAEACIPAVSFAVVDGSGTLLEGAAGVVDVEEQRPVTARTPFMLASASKAVVAVAVLMAEEDGLLDRHDPVDQHLPFDVGNHRLANDLPITVNHLAAHASGIRDNWDQVLDDSYAPGDPDEALGPFLRNYLVPGGEHFHRRGNFHVWPAGREWMYSNVGAALAAHTVAEVRGERFARYTEGAIFEPLGMEDSHWFLRDFADVEGVARPHVVTDEGIASVEHYGFPTFPDGQLRAPARDLAQVLRIAMGEGTVDGHPFVEAERARALRTPAVDGLNDWYIRPYVAEQYFFWFGMELGERWIIGHDGDDEGVTSEMFWDPETGVGVVVVASVGDGEMDGAVRETTAWLQEELFLLGEGR